MSLTTIHAFQLLLSEVMNKIGNDIKISDLFDMLGYVMHQRKLNIDTGFDEKISILSDILDGHEKLIDYPIIKQIKITSEWQTSMMIKYEQYPSMYQLLNQIDQFIQIDYDLQAITDKKFKGIRYISIKKIVFKLIYDTSESEFEIRLFIDDDELYIIHHYCNGKSYFNSSQDDQLNSKLDSVMIHNIFKKLSNRLNLYNVPILELEFFLYDLLSYAVPGEFMIVPNRNDFSFFIMSNNND